MKKLFLLHLLFWGLFSSCATILNTPTTTMVITSDDKLYVEVEGDTLAISRSESDAAFAVEKDMFATGRQVFFPEVLRSQKPARIRTRSDSTRHEILLDPVVSDAYWLNIPFTAAIGLLIDHRNSEEKKYSYPRLYIEIAGDSIIYTSYLSRSRKNYFDRVAVPRDYSGTLSLTNQKRARAYDTYHYKGRTSFVFGISGINLFKQRFDRFGHKISRGFYGLNLGFDVYYAKEKSIMLDAAYLIDYIDFIPSHTIFEFNKSHAFCAGLTDNFHWRRFSVGYGVGVSLHRRKQKIEYSGTILEDEYSMMSSSQNEIENHWAGGLVLNGRWKMSPNTKMGVTYRPTFYRFGSSAGAVYEHTISLDFLFFAELGRRR